MESRDGGDGRPVRGATAQSRAPCPAVRLSRGHSEASYRLPRVRVYAALFYEKGLNARVPSAETLMKQYCLNGTCGT